ncbi:MAG: pseudouridine synthase deg1, partial [Marteilia pararefringens]
ENLMLTRCGRTDKCVSAAKQIYGMYILIKEEKLDSTDFDISQILSPLNCILPDDIFAYSICHIADGEEFDARFGCSSRRYKYFFSNDSINIKV